MSTSSALVRIVGPNDGSIEMKTWMEPDNSLLSGIRFARQNGVPLIEAGAPGQLFAGKPSRACSMHRPHSYRRC